MAASAYASVTSLLHIMDLVDQHQNLRRQIFFDNQQIQSLRQSAMFLQEYLEAFSHSASDEEAEALERKITAAAHAAEDVIESHIVEQLHAASTNQLSASFVALRDLCQMIADMDSVKAMVTEVQGKATAQSHSISVVNTLKPPPSGKSVMVGLDDKLIEIKDKLTGDQHSRQVIPIIGMGGIGKTTLAKAVYHDSLIVEYFHLRIWITVSQEYSVKELLLQALKEIGVSGNLDSEERLGEKLYKSLFGRKYLLVLDDMWKLEDWEKIRCFFPDNSNKSRIVITSRISKLGAYLSSFAFNMDFLDEHKSWHLFCEKAFGLQCCPPEFEKIGKKIVEKCKGLPLSIVVIGGLLAKSSRTQEYWENVAKDLNSILCSNNDNQCLSILSWSYNHLPVHLKPCFLYMGIFREDEKILVSRLTRLWVAEGFLKPDKSKTLEEVAKNCLKDLIDRNLILVGWFGKSGNIRSCYIHDLLRDMCLNIAHKEKMFLNKSCLNCDISQDIRRERRVVIDASDWGNSAKNVRTMFNAVKLASVARSLLCSSLECDLQLVVNFELLRIWDQISDGEMCWDTEMDELFHYNINIRCLSFDIIHVTAFKALIPSVYRLWNLQTIVFGESTFGRLRVLVPIWQMPQLRHIFIPGIILPDPSSNQIDEFVMENLQTLKIVLDFKCIEQVLKSLPNIRKLKIQYDVSQKHSLDYCLNNVGRFQKLESFTCFCMPTCYNDLVPKLTFPHSLKKLTLMHTKLDWNYLTVIGYLPYLEVLRLDLKSVVGCEWNVVAGGFRSLKYLLVNGWLDLTFWVADSSEYFPVLQTVYLAHLYNLSEIPSGIAETPTLKLIDVFACSESVATSAVNILEEQFSMGNEDLQVRVKFSAHNQHMDFLEKVDVDNLESYTRQNLQIFGPDNY